jgi:hypothetical protein
MNYIEQFKAAARVSTPLVAIRTFDATATTTNIKASFGVDSGGDPKFENVPMVIWDCVHGPRSLSKAGEDYVYPIQEGVTLGTLLLQAEAAWCDGDKYQDAILFISNAHIFWENDSEGTIRQAIWNLRDTFKGNGHMLVLLMSPGAVLPQELVNDVLVLDEPLPTVDELKAIITETFAAAEAGPKDLTPEILEKSSDALTGLPAFKAEQTLSMSLNGTKGKRVLDTDSLWHSKREIINQTPGLRVYRGPETIESVGGIQSAKDFYNALMNGKNPPKVFIFLDEIEKMFAGTSNSNDPTKGEMAAALLSWMEDKNILGGALVGLPGTGKTNLGKCITGTYDVPLIEFNVPEMQSGLVGSSNANLRQAIKTIDAIGGDRVFALATSNGLDNLPMGLRRRFESIAPTYFFDVPSPTEKKAIWEIQRKAFKLAEQTLPEDTGWTGAEIRNCCAKADTLRVSLEQASKWVVPVTTSDAGRIQEMRLNATGKYLSASVDGIYHYNESKTESTTVEAKARRIKE